MNSWISLGPAELFKKNALTEVTVEGRPVAVSFHRGVFGAISGTCLHVGGPLAQGQINSEGYIVCPWHQWMFHCQNGKARPGIPAQVAQYELKEERGELWVNPRPITQNKTAEHAPHPLTREIKREPGRIRVLGISTTVFNKQSPRISTSEIVLEEALKEAKRLGGETKMIRLNDLNFRACEGYYSKSADACTWPCTITQMDPADELDQVYEGLIYWADIVLIATPIRWGAPSSLYFKMAERMNCIQNQETIANRHLIKNKIAAFLITGGQDNIQAVAGQMLTFFSELGFVFPPRPFVAHSRGWGAEDMENNITAVAQSEDLKAGVRALVGRCIESVKPLLDKGEEKMEPKKNTPYVMNMKPGEYYWCACGESEKQPFCDGAHARKNTGKTPLKINIPEDKKIAWCGCKQSKNGAFCDGTHSKL